MPELDFDSLIVILLFSYDELDVSWPEFRDGTFTLQGPRRVGHFIAIFLKSEEVDGHLSSIACNDHPTILIMYGRS